ncbi:unnamed protein product [Cylindrotheca closterium]|uniref:Calmodulin-lysine N-methyltransferase n=1 Tax=Cylindrotheca closterium TaxID=2856 RepID=A0AAD2G6J3_9STRA|nr:unnamed protein product [Cylindrotheca closterium]
MTEFQQGWREFHIHDTVAAAAKEGRTSADDGNNQDEEDVIYASGINLFGNIQEEEEEETMHFSFPVAEAGGCDESTRSAVVVAAAEKKNIEVTLKGFSDYTQSTGLAVWLGSEILARFMARHPYLIRGKTVMELGSGLGLAGITSHHLDSKTSVLTDGDSLVLNDYLKFNANQNDRRQQDTIGGDGHPGAIECHQLIWGHRGQSNGQSPLAQFRKKYGQFDVILAADCTYIPQSVEPFWETIDFLLDTEVTGKDDDTAHGITPAKSPSTPKVIYVMEASTQAKFEDILDSAKLRGFEWTIDTMPSLYEKDETPQDSQKEHEIYTFWRSRCS